MNTPSPTRTIAFVHGAFVSRHCWTGWIERCEQRGYACLAVAYPGREAPVSEQRRAPDAALLARLTFAEVLEHHVEALRALPEPPLVIGHSLGGLLTQLLLQRDVAVGGVAIDSVPPQGVTSLAWSFLRSLWPVINPLIPASRPYTMTFEQFCYSFANDLSPAEQRAAYEATVVPESRRVARGALSGTARIDFARWRPPLLMVAGERDHLMPPSLNRRNFRRYLRSPATTGFHEFAGRGHYSILAGDGGGWTEVLDHVLDWAVEVGVLQGAGEPGGRDARAGEQALRTGPGG